jgi:transketolase
VDTLWQQFLGDANEIAEAWRVIMQLRHEPICLMFSRQNMPMLDVAKSAYVLAGAQGCKAELILIGISGEVSLRVDAYEALTIGMHTFGASAPLKELQKKFGFTPDAVAAAKDELAKAK